MEVNSTRGNALVLMWSIKPMSTFWEDLKGPRTRMSLLCSSGTSV